MKRKIITEEVYRQMLQRTDFQPGTEKILAVRKNDGNVVIRKHQVWGDGKLHPAVTKIKEIWQFLRVVKDSLLGNTKYDIALFKHGESGELRYFLIALAVIPNIVSSTI